MNDTTLGDLEAYGAAFPDAPLYLACLGDCDGSADELLADFRKLRRGRPAQDLRLLRGRSLEELLRLRFCHPILQIDCGAQRLDMRTLSADGADQIVSWGRTVSKLPRHKGPTMIDAVRSLFRKTNWPIGLSQSCERLPPLPSLRCGWLRTICRSPICALRSAAFRRFKRPFASRSPDLRRRRRAFLCRTCRGAGPYFPCLRRSYRRSCPSHPGRAVTNGATHIQPSKLA